MLTLTRFKIVPAFVLGLTLAGANGALAASVTDTMSAEELADYQSQQLSQEKGQIVQPSQSDDNQLASAARTMSAEEFADYQSGLQVETILNNNQPTLD